MPKVGITDTILRDGHQSQAATRMKFSQMEPMLEKLDKVGYYSLECWGGATFDSCLRFLNEDPWERLRKLRKAMPNTKLQMLLRGQNLLGYKHYSDDVVEFFVKKAVENGIDIIRCFDALNDLRNMQTAVTATKKYGGKAEVAMSYTISDVHTEDYFVKLAADIEKMGADLICIKDMANLLLPYSAYSLIKRLKKETSLPIVLHTHDTTGTGAMTLLKAIEAGADVVDTCISALGNGTSQPTTESLVATLQGTEYDTGLDLVALTEIAAHFRKVAEELTQETFFKALKNIDSFKGQSKISSWLCQIAKNTYISMCRKDKHLNPDADAEQSASNENIEEAFFDQETAFAIHKVLHGLNEPYKEVFSLRTFGELSFKQIAELFGKTETWARVTYHRARLRIKEELK